MHGFCLQTFQHCLNLKKLKYNFIIQLPDFKLKEKVWREPGLSFIEAKLKGSLPCPFNKFFICKAALLSEQPIAPSTVCTAASVLVKFYVQG